MSNRKGCEGGVIKRIVVVVADLCQVKLHQLKIQRTSIRDDICLGQPRVGQFVSHGTD